MHNKLYGFKSNSNINLIILELFTYFNVTLNLQIFIISFDMIQKDCKIKQNLQLRN